MLLLGIDFETTGLDPKIDVITEVGLVFWDTETAGIVRLDGFLLEHKDLVISPFTTELTGITSQMCENYGRSQSVGLKYVLQWLNAADYIVAHNAPFDKEFLRRWCEANEVELPEKHWIDTKVDLDSQMSERFSRKLVYMAADHGLLNFFPHRAIFDVATMLTVLSKYDINEVLRYGQEPDVKILALVSYDDRELAKAQGYHWHGETKTWEKIFKESYVETARKVAHEAGFDIEVIYGS